MRGAVTDARWQPTRNLATNPSFETDDGTPGDYRLNYATHPIPVDIEGWYSNDGTVWAHTFDPTGGFTGGMGAKKYTRLASAESPNYLASVYAVGLRGYGLAYWPTIAAGQAITGSVYTKSEVPCVSHLELMFYDASGGSLSFAYGPDILAAANEWARPYVAAVAPAGAAYGALGLYVLTPDDSPAVAGTNTWATGALYEKNVSVLLPYFDGGFDSTGDPDVAPTWFSTPGVSPSTLLYDRPSDIHENYTAHAIQSSQWAASGSKSLRLVSMYPYPGSSYCSLATSYLATNGGNPGGLQQGHTYTAQVTARLAQLREATAQLAFVYESPSGSYISIHAAVPNVVGEHQISITFTVPEEDAYWELRLVSNARIGEPDVWFDNLMITEGTYSFAYADGDSPGWRWDGTPRASTSRGWPKPA